MIHPATKAIEATFKEREVKYKVFEIEDASAVETGFGFEAFSYKIIFLSQDDDTDVHVASELLRVPEEKRQAILPVLNQINNEHRYFSFYLDEDGSVYAQFHFPISTPMEVVGEVAFEMLVRSGSTFKEVYPQLMKVAWG